MLKIGLLREIKSTETRVMLTPEGVKVLVQNGVDVFVENKAGEACRFDDLLYERAGATVLPTMEKVLQRAQILLHVSAPQPIEFEVLNESHIIFSFLNLQKTQAERLQALQETQASFISSELIQDENGAYPLLLGMSEIAGKMAVFQAAEMLSIRNGGKGKLLFATQESKPAAVTIVGAGQVGRTAAAVAALNGVTVNLLTLNPDKLHYLRAELPDVNLLPFSLEKLAELLPETDVLIVALYSLKKAFDFTISRDLITLMEKGSVLMDVSAEQAAVVETSALTNIEQPAFVKEGIVHYCVPNMAALVPTTASRIITKKLLPFIKVLALKGLKEALVEMPGLVPAMSIYKGKVTNRRFADHFAEEFYNIFELLELNL